jgi:hypothetical protein
MGDFFYEMKSFQCYVTPDVHKSELWVLNMWQTLSYYVLCKDLLKQLKVDVLNIFMKRRKIPFTSMELSWMSMP